MMSLRTIAVALLSGPVLLLAGGAGCSTLTGSESEDDRSVEYLVADVDSIDAPGQIAPSDTLKVRMRGTVGPNSCYGFDGFDASRATSQLTITPIVAHTTADNIACATVIVPLDRTYTAAPPFASGTLTVTVPQSDRPDVTTTVEVTDGQ